MPSGLARARTKRAVQVARPVADDDLPEIEVQDEDEPSTNYALRLTEALQAIAAAQGEGMVAQPASAAPRPSFGRAAKPADETAPLTYARTAPRARRPKAQAIPAKPLQDDALAEDVLDVPTADASAVAPKPRSFVAWLAALDKLPPIRLPIGPAIPWRLGLPVFVGLTVVMLVVGRAGPGAAADVQGTRLPAAETYAVQQEAPLFTNKAADPQVPTPNAKLGVADPAPGVDILDIGLKLVAVLALAYGSLMLLKRTSIGGAGPAKVPGAANGMRVVATLSLAPNRSVHLLQAPGGKSLLVGATPTQVNLIADLGQLTNEASERPTEASFFDVLSSKITGN